MFMNSPSVRRTRTALCTTTRSPRAFTRRAVSRRSRTRILRDARCGDVRWEADGEVRELDGLYRQLRQGKPAAGPASTIGAPVDHLDLATVIYGLQAASVEFNLEKLIERSCARRLSV